MEEDEREFLTKGDICVENFKQLVDYSFKPESGNEWKILWYICRVFSTVYRFMKRVTKMTHRKTCKWTQLLFTE